MEDHSRPQQPWKGERTGRKAAGAPTARQDGQGQALVPGRPGLVLEPGCQRGLRGLGTSVAGRAESAELHHPSGHSGPTAPAGPQGATTLQKPPPRRTSGFAGHQRATPWLPSPARLLPPGQPGSQRGAWGDAWGRGPGRKAGQPGCAHVSGPAGGAAMPPSGRSENACATQPAPPGSGPGPQEPAALAYGGGRGGGRAHVHLAITHWP